MRPGRPPGPARGVALGALVALGLLCALPGSLPADTLVLEGGRTLRGHVVRTATEVLFNPYRSQAPSMTFGQRRLALAEVKRIEPDEDEGTLHAALERALAQPAAARDEALRALWATARRRSMRDLATRVAEQGLALGMTDADLLKQVGGPERWSARRRGDVRLDAVLAARVAGLLSVPRSPERAAALVRLAGETGLVLDLRHVERMARSLDEPVGVLEEQPLAWPVTGVPASARFTLYVPPDLHPLVPAPLVIALHGGGTLERPDRTRVVAGSGKDMLPLVLPGARQRGWLVLCPTALEAPWDTPAHRALLEAALAEVGARWNVDLARVHLVGVGEGAEGAWALGASMAERLASVAVAGGPPSGLASTLLGRGLCVWVGHGEADERFPVEPVRKLAARLVEQAAFTYCELPEAGHGLAAEAEQDWYRAIEGRRNPRARDAWPQPSLALPPGEAEQAARGDLAAVGGAGLPGDMPAERLWDVLPRAEGGAAAERLLALRPAGMRERASALLAQRDASRSVRTEAAWLLGELGDPQAGLVLGEVLRGSDDPALRLACARALRRLADPQSVEDLRWALQDAWQAHQRASFTGGRVPLVAFERLVRLCGALVEALARVGQAAEVGPDIEQALVLGALKDPRPVEGRRGPGASPSSLRADLVRSVARAYRTLGVEATLVDMLRATVRRDAAATEALVTGLREGVGR
ncbi:MAG: HEAT repeat domain-containing protein [Planctomycetia bacterium]